MCGPSERREIIHRAFRGERLNFQDKIVNWADLPRWRQGLAVNKALVVTNGCFDLLHLGHVSYLEAARNRGDMLLVGVNDDSAVRLLKGEGRPINSETDRGAVIAALESVSAVCVFPGQTATEFLKRASPNIYVKGGDYTLDTLNQEERRTVEAAGGKISILPMVPNRSTTGLVQKLTAGEKVEG